MTAFSAKISEIIQAAEKLNDTGKWITLQQCIALSEHDIYRKKQTTDTLIQHHREFKKEGNVIFPKWA